MITPEWVAKFNEEVSMRLESGEDAQYILEDLAERLEEMSQTGEWEKK